MGTDAAKKPDSAAPETRAAPRDRLISHAAALFADKGFDGVSVREICMAAGTSINMIHHYFGSKNGLLEAVVERYGDTVFSVPLRLMQSPARSRDDLISRIEMLIETTLEACLAERDVMMVVLREQSALPPLVQFQAAFVGFIDQAKTDGLARPDLDGAMVSGAILDRVINQAQFAPWIKKTSGIDLANDADYRRDWCRANADLFLRGMLVH